MTGPAASLPLSSAAASRWTLGILCAMAGSVAFSGKAIIVKLGYRHGADAVTLIMLRMAVALPFFVAAAWWAGRGRPALSRRDVGSLVGLGFSGYYLASMLDFAGLAHVSAGLERLVLYLNPTLVMLLGWLLLQRPVPGRQWLPLGLSYAGVLLAFGHEVSLQGSNVPLGTLLVFASALSYALYLLYSGELVGRLGVVRLTGWASSIASLLCIVQYLALRPLSDLATLAAPVWWLSLLNGTVCTVLPVFLVMIGIDRLGASKAAQIGMVGPISTILMGVFILGEPFTPWMAAGTVLVMGGVGLLTRQRS